MQKLKKIAFSESSWQKMYKPYVDIEYNGHSKSNKIDAKIIE